jgi:perosamine synthetase
MQAALGISQLKRLDDFVVKRRDISERYFDELPEKLLPYQHPDAILSWHLFVIKVDDRKKLINN